MAVGPIKIDVSDDMLSRLSRVCYEVATSADHGEPLSVIDPSQHFGELDPNVLHRALCAVVRNVDDQELVVKAWRILNGASLPATTRRVRDVTPYPAFDSLCALLCVAGDGVISFSRQREEERPTTTMEDIELKLGSCIIYPCNITYAVRPSTTVYLHCVYGVPGARPEVSVFQQLAFPCPYNSESSLGDVRAYPKAFRASTTSCTYRGSKWKNVLHHLANCRANPNVEQRLASQSKRRERNNQSFRCELCSHKPFTKYNSYVRHRLRRHPQGTTPTPAPPDCVATEVLSYS
jgi:hypothetical protein